MKIEIKNPHQFQLVSTNALGKQIIADAGKAVGGEDSGFRAMEMVLSAVGSCSSIDLLLILKKYKKPYRDFKVDIVAERLETIPKVFNKMKLTYYVSSDITQEQFERAADLALNKYCSVSAMLKDVEITFECKLTSY